MNNQRGSILPIIILILIVIAIPISVYLINNPQILRSRASANPIIFISSGRSCDPNLGKCETSDNSVKISITSTLGPPGKESTASAQAVKPPELDISKLRAIYKTKKGQANFDVNYDLNSDGEINSFDYYTLIIRKIQNPSVSINTVSYKIAEDPVSLDQEASSPYASEPVVLDYKFKNNDFGQKVIWVEFIGSDGSIDKKTAQINYLNKEPTPTAMEPTVTSTQPSPTAQISISPTVQPSVSPAEGSSLLPGGNPVSVTPAQSSDQSGSAQTNTFFGSGN